MTTTLLIFQIFTLFCIILPKANSNVFNYPAVFNFGDSNSDTGEGDAGQTHFNASSGRACDGRLIIDFLMESMKFDYLHRYLGLIGITRFRQGCNFAIGGSTILPQDSKSVSFDAQVDQFIHFKTQVLDLLVKGKDIENLPAEDSFVKGLYMFDIGQNDVSRALAANTSDETNAFIPNLLAEFEKGLKRLYDQGARNFWIHNTGPLGCLTYVVAAIRINSNYFGKDGSKLDGQGCVSGPNQAARLFNQQLHDLCKKLHRDFKDSNVTYVDIYTIKSDLIANYSRYGFEQPIMACCGSGGPPLNYGPASCGKTRVIKGISYTGEACKEKNKYVNWDGTHYTEAANLHVSKRILTGLYSDPPFADKMLSIPVVN